MVSSNMLKLMVLCATYNVDATALSALRSVAAYELDYLEIPAFVSGLRE